MSSSVALLAGVLLASVPAQASEQAIFPRLERGQELLYRGTFDEEAARPGVRFRRSYQVEIRVFVLERDSSGYDLALLTLFKPSEQGPPIVGFDRLRLSLQGRLHPNILMPIEGPATLETGMFVPLADGRLGVQKSWDVTEDSRPPRAWKVVGNENLRGTQCYKLTGVQTSDEWGRARVERLAWRRTDQAWIAPLNGYASTVHRDVEIQDPSSAEPNSRYQLRYDLETKLLFPGQISEERRTEIAAALRFQQEWKTLQPRIGSISKETFEALEQRVGRFIDSTPATPYREALLAIQRKASAARTGHTAPVIATERQFGPQRLQVGVAAPEFLTMDVLNGESVRLSRYRGKATVVLYFNAEAASAEPTLRFLESLREKMGTKIGLLAVAMKGDRSRIEQLNQRLGVRLDIVAGEPVRKAHQIETTPYFAVLDSAGIVRAVTEGWGSESAALLLREIDRWWNR